VEQHRQDRRHFEALAYFGGDLLGCHMLSSSKRVRMASEFISYPVKIGQPVEGQ
jgi:hypothetical protein